MHYLQLFVTKIEEGDIEGQSQEQIEEYLEQYQNVFWDWYSFGGRWSDLFGGRTTVPYEEALPKLMEMLKDRDQSLIDNKPRVLEALNREGKSDFMDAYYIRQYGVLLGKDYNDNSLFYNIEYGGSFELPEEGEILNQYYVTIVDLHN